MTLMGVMGNPARLPILPMAVRARACLYVYDSDRPGQGYLTHARASWAQ